MPDPDTFTCAVCEGTFEKAWTDEEALAEAEAHGFDTTASDNGVVCDECFEKVMAFNDHPIGEHRVMGYDILHETRCIYCQKDYGTPARLQAHVVKDHPGTYADYSIADALAALKEDSDGS